MGQLGWTDDVEAIEGLGDDAEDRVLALQYSFVLWLDSTKSIRFWDFTQKVGRDLGPRPAGYDGSLTVSRDGRWLAIEGYGKTGIFSIGDNGLNFAADLASVSGVRFSSDSQRAAWLRTAEGKEKTVQVAWIDLKAPKMETKLILLASGQKGVKLEPSAEGSAFICATQDAESELRLWHVDLATGSAMARLEPTKDVTSLCVGENTKIVAAAGMDGVLRVWEWPTLRPLLNRPIGIEAGGEAKQSRVLVSPHGDSIAVLRHSDFLLFTTRSISKSDVVQGDAGVRLLGEAEVIQLNAIKHESTWKINGRPVPANDDVRAAWLQASTEMVRRRERYFVDETATWDLPSRLAVTQPIREFLSAYAGKVPALDTEAKRALLFSHPLAEIDDIAWLRGLLADRLRLREPFSAGICRELDAVGGRLPAAMWNQIRLDPVNAEAAQISKLIVSAGLLPLPEKLPTEIKGKVDALSKQLVKIFGDDWREKETPPKAPEPVAKLAEQFRTFAKNWRTDETPANDNAKRKKFAWSWIELALELDPSSSVSWNERGVIQFAAEDWKQAAELFAKAANLGETVSEQSTNHSNRAVALSRYADEIAKKRAEASEIRVFRTEALDAAKRGVNAQEDRARAWMVLGDRLSDLHRYEEAGDAYRKATQLNPESDDLRNLVASFRQIRLLDDAIIIAEWVSIDKPDDVYNLVELGELRRQGGYVLKQTVEAYKKAEELEKDKPPEQRDGILHRWKAMALMQGRLSGEEVDDKQIIAECDAEIARQEAVAKASGKNVGEESAGGRSDKAKCLWVLGRLDESEKILREISSQSTSALFYLGWRCLQTQREAEGRKLLNGLVEKVPAGAWELPDWELRPRALALLGQRDQAMEELTAIEQAAPGLKLTVAIERARVELISGKTDDALAQLAEVVRAGLVDVALIEQDPCLRDLANHQLGRQLVTGPQSARRSTRPPNRTCSLLRTGGAPRPVARTAGRNGRSIFCRVPPQRIPQFRLTLRRAAIRSSEGRRDYRRRPTIRPPKSRPGGHTGSANHRRGCGTPCADTW